MNQLKYRNLTEDDKQQIYRFERKIPRIIDKQDKEPASAARRLGHKSPQCGHFSEMTV